MFSMMSYTSSVAGKPDAYRNSASNWLRSLALLASLLSSQFLFLDW